MKKRIILSILVVYLVSIMGFLVFAQMSELKVEVVMPKITKTAEVTLNVRPKPDFTLELSMVEIDVYIGRTASFTASATSVNAFAGDIVFSIDGIPPEMVEITPSNTLTLGEWETKGVQFELMIPDDPELVDIYTLVVAASSDTYN